MRKLGLTGQRRVLSVAFLSVLLWMALRAPPAQGQCPAGTCFRRGDANVDGFVDASDALYILNYLFLGGAGLRCPEAAQVIPTDELNLSDAINLLNYLYTDGPAPVAPFPGCGPASGPCDYPRSLCEGTPPRNVDPTLHLAFDAPLVIEGPPSEKVQAMARVTLDNSFIGAPLVEGWNLTVRSEPVSLLAITGASARDPPDTRFPPKFTTGEGNEGVVHAAILLVGLPLPLSVDQPPHVILHLALEAAIPSSGCAEARLLFKEGLVLGENRVVHDTLVLSEGRRYHPFSRPVEVSICANLPELLHGVPRELTLTPASPQAIFKLRPPVSVPVLVRLDDEDPEDSNVVYLGWERVPSPLSFDEAAQRADQAGQRFIAPISRGGTAYLLVQGLAFHGGENRLRLETRFQELSVDSVSTDCASRGCSGEIHAVVRGGAFDDGTVFTLERGGEVIGSRPPTILGDDRAEVIFDLTVAIEGDYDLVVRKADLEDRLPRVVKVVRPRIGPRLEVTLEAPGYYRPGRLQDVKVIYRNTGDEEMLAPYFRLVGPPDATFQLEGLEEARLGFLELLGIHRAGVAGRLPPGGRGEAIVLFRSQAEVEVPLRLLILEPGAGDRLEWTSMGPPPGVAEESWPAVRAVLAEGMGPSWPRCHEALADVATRAARLGLPASSVLGLWRFAYREALRGPSAAILGKARDEVGDPLPGRKIVARDGDDVSRACAVTGAEGEFTLRLLPPGTYTLFLETFEDRGPPVALFPGEDRAGVLFTPTDPGQVNFDCPAGEETGLPAAAPAPGAGLFKEETAATLVSVDSIDPNEKEGPGEGLPVQQGQTVRYTIFFENLSEAKAAAAHVLITDVLDSRLDPLSLVLEPILLGKPDDDDDENDTVIAIEQPVDPHPSFRFQGSARRVLSVPFPDPDERTPVQLDIQAYMALETSTMTWSLSATHPVTGGNLFDARAGFLPPNDASHRGEGQLSYTVKVRPDAPVGQDISNQAFISFDGKAAIATKIVTRKVARAEVVPFMRGDVNQSGDVDISDAIFLLAFLFTGGDTVLCRDAADANDDGGTGPDVSDAIYLLDWRFQGGEPPPAPGPSTCGLDPGDVGDHIECSSFDRCKKP